MRLFHFSETPGIELFEPRPGRHAAGPVVWAIDEPHAFLYLFPRDCPRILIWPKAATTEADHARWMGNTTARAVAYVETGWLGRLRATVLYRYELPPATFIDLNDAGMWVSSEAVRPLDVTMLTDLPGALAAANVELRSIDDLATLRPVWDSTLHASGIRLRNAKTWD